MGFEGAFCLSEVTSLSQDQERKVAYRYLVIKAGVLEIGRGWGKSSKEKPAYAEEAEE